MKRIKRVIALILCAAMLISAGAIGASAETKTDCGGNCDQSPVVILPGINHSPTYLFDENNQPVLDSDGNQVGGTLLILEVEQLIKKVLPKLIFSVLAR